MKYLLALVAIFSASACFGADHLVYAQDFSTQPDGNALPWLKGQGFEFKLGFEKLNPRFKSGALWLSTQKEETGMCGISFPKGKDLPPAKRLRLTWGVTTFPAGADFERGMNRMSLGVLVSFGHERLSSGLPLGVGAAPHFICAFLGAKEPAGKTYTGKYWKTGGRYVCANCVTPGVAQVSEFDLDSLFQSLFQKPAPPISGFAIEMNTKDTDGKASAFIKKIEFLR
jgi:hypothetical protein